MVFQNFITTIITIDMIPRMLKSVKIFCDFLKLRSKKIRHREIILCAFSVRVPLDRPLDFFQSRTFNSNKNSNKLYFRAFQYGGKPNIMDDERR